jgi:hypothetical protein
MSANGLVGDGWEALICAIGLVLSPMVGILYGVLRCTVKQGTAIVECIVEDILATSLSVLTVGGLFCFNVSLSDSPSVEELLTAVAHAIEWI